MSLASLGEASVTLAGGWLPGQAAPDYFPLGGDPADTHQLEMREALKRGDDTILNANATGGGKTLSWAAPVICGSGPELVLATYPTTTLLEDQQATLLEYFRRYHGTSAEPWASERDFDLVERDDAPDVLSDGSREFGLVDRVVTVSSSANPARRTDEHLLAAYDDARKAATAGLPTVILTTPDTLTLLATNRFHNYDVYRVVNALDAIVVDEFHLASDRARRLLPFHLDTYRSLSGRYLDTFVFLSATPQPAYVDRLQRAFDPTIVTNALHSERESVESTRQILPETYLAVRTRPRFANGEWLASNVDSLAEAHAPPGQLLVIVDSVREVERAAAAVDSQTDLTVGRVYGWQSTGRQQTIDDADVVVGNTAVEVGVDFERVNRLVLTAYEASSTLQRLGRMRHRSRFDDYSALLLTTEAVQSELLARGDAGPVTRPALDDALHTAFDTQVDRPYYDLLCGAYTRYLWFRATNPLKAQYAGKKGAYRDVGAAHFGTDYEDYFGDTVSTEEFWSIAGRIVDESSTRAIFDELHQYRPSSLGAVVVDATDNKEPLKTYSLRHVLRHREGKVVPLDEVRSAFRTVHGRGLTATESAQLDHGRRHAVGGFVSRGTCTAPRDYYLNDFGFVERMRDRVQDGRTHQAIDTLSSPAIKTDPGVDGLQHLEFGDEPVLAQYVPRHASDVRERFGLGAYAAVVPTTRDGSLLLWDDAIKAHAQLVTEAYRDSTDATP